MSLDNSLELNFSEVINMIETRRNNAYKKVFILGFWKIYK